MLILLMPLVFIEKLSRQLVKNELPAAYQQAILHRYAYLLAYRGTFEPYGPTIRWSPADSIFIRSLPVIDSVITKPGPVVKQVAAALADRGWGSWNPWQQLTVMRALMPDQSSLTGRWLLGIS